MGIMKNRKAWLGILVLALAALGAARGQDAVKIDPENPKYLLFRGKPLLLVSA